uniref:IPT/TIG domain-containing protein n=1 Tax=Cryptomonas curvata TaxID=233186 RepID=A0A7S0QN78_9CRYP
MDVAEMMIYNSRLTIQEMDRVGNYLSVKFNLQSFRLNYDVGSPTRSVAISKGCGCAGPSMLWLPSCNTAVGPYCLKGARIGTSQTPVINCKDSQISISVNDALNPIAGTVSGPAVGGNPIIIKGYYVLPTDISRESGSGILGGESVNGLVQINIDTRDPDMEVSSQYLAVSFKYYPQGCKIPGSHTLCRPTDMIESWATDCKIKTFASTGTNDANHPCQQWIPPNPVPEIRCIAPAGMSAGTTVTIYWHGIPTALSYSYQYMHPIITKILPRKVSFMNRQQAVTLLGENFGVRESWQKHRNAKLAFASIRSRVEIWTTALLQCRETNYVSDSQIICITPALHIQRHKVNADRSVAVQVVVNTGSQRSQQTKESELIYIDVPLFYNCDNHKSKRPTCFVCCRSACIVDEFSQGAKRGGMTYDHCDTACHKYCGFVPTMDYHGPGRRLFLSGFVSIYEKFSHPYKNYTLCNV